MIPSIEDRSEARARPRDPEREPTRSTFFAVTALASYVALLFHEVLIGKLLFWLDTHLTFEPLFKQLGENILTGRPLWSALLETGKPILANPTQAALYPPNLLFALLSASRALSVLTFFHVLLGSVGTFLLARRLRVRNHSALVSGFLFAGAGTTLSATPYVGLSWCTAWLPWLLLFCDRVARREHTGRSMVLLGLVVFMMLTIAEPMILMAALLGVALWLGDEYRQGDGVPTDRLRNTLLLPTVAAMVAALVLSPYLLAIAVNLPHSIRALGFTWDGVNVWSLHPLRLFEWLAPGVFGFLGKADTGAFWAFATVPVKGFPYFAGIYVGAPALALFGAGICGGAPRRTPLAIWLTLLVLLALGRWGPLYPWLEGAPGFDSARYPVKWLIPAIVPLSLLAGLGLEKVLSPQGKQCRRVYVVVLLLSALILATTAVAVHSHWFTGPLEIVAKGGDGTFSPDNRRVVVDACLRGLVSAIAAIGLIAVFRRYRTRPLIAATALSLLVAADLIAANIHLIETTDVEFFEREPAALQVIRSDPQGFIRVRIDENTSNSLRWAAGRRPTMEQISLFQRETLAGYVAARFGFPSALTRDTEATGSHRVFFLKVLGESAPPREQAMVYGSASITHLVTDREIAHPVYHRLSTIQTVAGTSIHVYRNSLAQPRVHVVQSLIPYEGDVGYRQTISGSGLELFAHAALIDANDLVQAHDELIAMTQAPDRVPPGGSCSARVVSDEGHRLTIQAETDSPAILVVSDAFLPQWSARVDGTVTPLLRVNYCFRGIHLDEGDHTVVLEYAPWKW